MKGELILSRSEGETIIIDPSPDPVCVRVVSINGDRVRVGVVAPAKVHVMRGELDSGGGRRFDHEFRPPNPPLRR